MLNRFLSKTSRRLQSAGQEDDAEHGIAEEPVMSNSDDEDNPSDAHHGSQQADLHRLRQLNEQLLRAHRASAMHLISQEQLLRLLKLLGAVMKQGCGRVVHPDEEVCKLCALTWLLTTSLMSGNHTGQRLTLHSTRCAPLCRR